MATNNGRKTSQGKDSSSSSGSSGSNISRSSTGNNEEAIDSSNKKQTASDGKENKHELWGAMEGFNSSQQKNARNQNLMDETIREHLWQHKKWTMSEEELAENGTACRAILSKTNGLKKDQRNCFWARCKGRIAHVLSKKRSSTTGMIKLKVFGM